MVLVAVDVHDGTQLPDLFIKLAAARNPREVERRRGVLGISRDDSTFLTETCGNLRIVKDQFLTREEMTKTQYGSILTARNCFVVQ